MADDHSRRAFGPEERKAFDAVTRECEAKLAGYRAALARQPDDLESACEVESYLGILGSRMLHIGELDAALAAFGEGLAFSRDRAARDTYDGWPACVAFALDSIGRVKLEMGDHAGARQAYDEALEIRRDYVARYPESDDWPKYLSWNLDYIGDVMLREGDADGARTAYEESLAIRRDFAARYPTYTDWQWAIAMSHDRLADLELQIGTADNAERLHAEADDIRRKVEETDRAEQRMISLPMAKL